MHKIRAITFDFWGTLTSSSSSNRHNRVAELQARLPYRSLAEVAAAYDQAWSVFMGLTRQGLGLHTGYILAETLRLLDTSLEPPSFAIVQRYWEEVVLVEPPPLDESLCEMLSTLRQRGLWIGLISDTGASPGRAMRQVLDRAGLTGFFDWLTFSDELGVTKAHPQAFLTTISHFGVCPEQALHVGDTPAADIDGAHVAGLYAALLLEHSSHPEAADRADLVLQRLADLPDALLGFDASA